MNLGIFKRYPGIAPFKRSEAELFCGREKEINAVFSLIKTNRLTVIFGRSGTGKSSLVNAGICPKLEENGLLAVNIRFQWANTSSDTTPRKLTISSLSSFAKMAFPEGYTPEGPLSLWEAVKMCKFPMQMSPVLIFDQFEELFNMSVAEQEPFLYELAELVHNQVPNSILNWISKIPIEDRTPEQIEWCQQPECRILIGIRSDRFYELDRLGNIIPQILRNRFELLPLNPEQAQKAILEPARNKNISSPPYTLPYDYEPEALKEILDQLSAGRRSVEASYLQILCSELEDSIAEKEGSRSNIVTLEDVKGSGGIKIMIDTFYKNQIEKFESLEERMKVRILLEEKLMEEGKRTLLSDVQVTKFLGQHAYLVRRLQELRLIKSDSREEQILYEISHDILLEAIKGSREKRQQEEQRIKDEKIKEEKELQFQKEQKELRDHLERIAKENRMKEEMLTAQLKAAKLKSNLLIIQWVFIIIVGVSMLFVFNTNRKNSKLLAMIYTSQAEMNYGNGFHVLSYVIWKKAFGRSKEVAEESHFMDKKIFAPFAGKALKFSPDADFVISTDANNNKYLWKVDDLSITLDTSFKAGEKVYFLTDSKYCFIADSAHKNIYNPSTKKCIEFGKTTMDESKSKIIEVMPGGDYFYSIDSSKRMTVFSVKEEKLLSNINNFLSQSPTIKYIEIDSTNMLIYREKSVYLINMETEAVTTLPMVGTDFKGNVLICKGSIAAYIYKGVLNIVSLKDGKMKKEAAGFSAYYKLISFLNNGKEILVERDLHNGYDDVALVVLKIGETWNLEMKTIEDKCSAAAVLKDRVKVAYLDKKRELRFYDSEKGGIVPTGQFPDELTPVEEQNVIAYRAKDTWYIAHLSDDQKYLVSSPIVASGKDNVALSISDEEYIYYKIGDTLKVYNYEKRQLMYQANIGKQFPQQLVGKKFIVLWDNDAQRYYAWFIDRSKNNLDQLQYIYRDFIDTQLTTLGVK